MKKIFTLFIALFAIIYCTNAQTTLFSEDFSSETMPAGWKTIDADGDGFNWRINYTSNNSGYDGQPGFICSESYDNDHYAPLHPDNWIITPAIDLTAATTANLSYYAAAQDAGYPADHYGVYISKTGTATSDFTLLFEETMDANGGTKDQGTWKQKNIDISDYTGNTVYIAFRHFKCSDNFQINIDKVEVTTETTATTTFNLYVAGTQVTSVNQDDILGDGKVSYTPATKTLTMNNATITINGEQGMMNNEIEDLKINLIGNNTITATGGGAITSYKNFSIIGKGTLTAQSDRCTIYANECNLTIEGVTITAIGNWGVAGENGETNSLTIKNATVKAMGTTGSICDFKAITLDGCQITQPTGAVVDGGAVKLDGNIVTDEVVIEPTGNGVANHMADNVKVYTSNRILTVKSTGKQAITVYNIMGQVVATKRNPNTVETFTLPAAGVYVVRVGNGSAKVVAQ